MHCTRLPAIERDFDAAVVVDDVGLLGDDALHASHGARLGAVSARRPRHELLPSLARTVASVRFDDAVHVESGDLFG